MKKGWERRAHLRESSLWDSALLSRKEIKKTAERTPVTFRDEQLRDTLCIASIRAAELLSYTSSCGFMLFSLLPHGCNDAFTVALLQIHEPLRKDFSHEVGRSSSCPGWSGNLPSTEEEIGV